MARFRSQRRRDANAITNRRLPVSKYNPLSQSAASSLRPMSLSQFEDFRQWHPQGAFRTPRTFTTPVTRLRAVDRLHRYSKAPIKRAVRAILPGNPLSPITKAFDQTQTALAFANPDKTLVCVRRAVRREVLHALQLVRRGGSGGVKSEWNDRSNIRCR